MKVRNMTYSKKCYKHEKKDGFVKEMKENNE